MLKLFLSSFFTLLVLCPLAAQAGKIEMNTELTEKGMWDSNPLMLTENEKSLYGSTTNAALFFSSQTPTLKLENKSLLSQNIFNQKSYNSTDIYDTFSLSKTMQVWQAVLRSNISYDTTRSSEISTFAQDIGATRRLSYNAEPSFSWMPNEKTSLNLLASYTKVNYDGSILIDYTTFFLQPSVHYKITPEHEGVLSLNFKKYQAANASETQIDSLTPSSEWLFKLTPNLKGKLLAGAELSQRKDNGTINKNSEWNTIYTAELTYENEQDKTIFDFSRAPQAYSNGNESLLTTIGLKNTHKINEKLSFTLWGNYQIADTSNNSTLKNKLNTEINLSYFPQPDIEFKTSYAYRREEYNNNSALSHANVGSINIIWHGPFSTSNK